MLPVSSAHAVEAVVVLLDDSGFDCDLNVITWALINHQFLSFEAAFPDVCDKLRFAAQIKNKKTKEKSELRLG